MNNPQASGTPASSVPPLGTPPGLVPNPPVIQQQQPPTLESQLLVQTVQQQQQQISQMMSLVESLVARQQPVYGPENRPQAAAGALSDISSIHSMEVDEGGAPIRNPKAENYVPKMPLLDGGKMSKGRRSEIEAWVDYLEVFLPWIALFDDRIPSEVQKYIAREEAIVNNSLPKGESIRSTRLFLYLRQSFSNYPRGLDILKQIEREQLGVSAGYEAMRRLHQDLSVCSRIEASTLREEVLRYSPPKVTKERPLDVFRNVQVELAKYARLISGFPDLFLSEADQSMIVLKNLDVEVKRYVLLHAKIDSMVELERAIKFYDANIKILNFAEKGKDHANPLLFEEKGKGKGKEKGEKGKGKGKDGDKTKGKEKGKAKEQEKGKGKEKGKSNNGKGKGEEKSSGSNQPEKPKDPNKYAHIKCYNCNEMGHFSNKCPKAKAAKANAALLEPQLAGAALAEPQLFAVALDVPPGCAVYSMCDDDSSSDCLTDDDLGLALMFEHAFGIETEDEGDVELESLSGSCEGCVELVELERVFDQQSREDPVVLENPVELESVGRCSVGIEGAFNQQSGEDPVVLENPVELASFSRDLHEDTRDLDFCHVFHECEEPSDFESCLGESDLVDVELAVDMDMCAAVTRSRHSKADIAATASDAMWWLVDSGASTHLINEETLQGVRVVSQSEHAGVDCVTATGASVGIRKSAVVQVEFRLGDPEGQTVLVELEVLVAPVRFNLLSLGRLLDRSWDVQFVPDFRVRAAQFSFLTRWKQNCGWLLSVPSVSSSASSVVGSHAVPSKNGSPGQQSVLPVKRGGGSEREPDCKQHGSGAGLRGRASCSEQDDEPSVGEARSAEGEGKGPTKDPSKEPFECSKGQLEFAKDKGDAKEESCVEAAQDGPDALASEVLRRSPGQQREEVPAEEVKGPRTGKALQQAGRGRDLPAAREGDGQEVPRLRPSEAVPLGSSRSTPPGSDGRSRHTAEEDQLRSRTSVGGGDGSRSIHYHYPRREDDGYHSVEDSRVRHQRSSPQGEQQGLSLHPAGAAEGPTSTASSYASSSPAQRGAKDTRQSSENANYTRNARNLEQGTIGSSGDRVACFVAVPAVRGRGLEKQKSETDTATTTSTTSTTINPPTSSSVVLGKSPRRVVLDRKKVVGCACCDLGDHVEHVELDCVDLHVEHDVGMAVGDLQEIPNAAENPEAWLLRGDRELLQLAQWGKVNRDHVLRSHVPFNASCEHCVRGRGLEPARRVEREEGQGAQKEVQVDKFQYKGLWFLVLVLVGCFAIGAVQYREVSGPRGNEARESMLADMSAWGRSVGLVGVDARDLSVCVRSDLEGVVRNLAQGFADGLTAGAVEVTDVPVGRHAPVAERAVRTLKESANTLCVGLESVGLEPYGNGVTYLLKHCAQAHNRYGHLQGSALSPEQKALRTLKSPHPMYVWGAAVVATPPPSLRDKITGRHGQAAYLGPEVASGSHIVQFRLRDGSYKIARSARIRMVVPVTFELSCLRGVCRLLPGRSAEAAREFPRIEGENVRDLPLPDVETRGPPREWIEEHGRTPRCRVCRARGIDVSKAYRSPACRKRYADFIKNSFDPAKFLLDEGQAELEGGKGDLGELGFEPERGLELPDGPALEEELDYSPDYLPEEAAPPGAGIGSDDDVERGVELELHEGELVDPSSSLVEFAEDEEAMMEVEPEALERVPREDAEGMMMNIEHREALSFAAVSPKEEIVELGGEKLVVEMPYSAVDDTNGGVLDVGLTYEGMLRELRALESLAVGDVIWEVNPKEKVISTRWVSNAKTERLDGKENQLVRCRVVARDFAQGATAAQLGISSATSSAEALRTFICYAGSKRRNIVGLDVSTAFLFADLDELCLVPFA